MDNKIQYISNGITKEITKDELIIMLRDRISKAIEYIENKVVSNGEVIDQLRKIEVKELLEILDKGE